MSATGSGNPRAKALPAPIFREVAPKTRPQQVFEAAPAPRAMSDAEFQVWLSRIPETAPAPAPEPAPEPPSPQQALADYVFGAARPRPPFDATALFASMSAEHAERAASQGK